MRSVKITRRHAIIQENLRDQPALLQRIYANRGITCSSQLQNRLTQLVSPNLLGGLDQAAQYIADAINQKQSILVVGDYDADGATGTALAVRGLGMLGASQVDFLVPNRFIHGYGLSPELVAEIPQLQPDLLITVDNGIASLAGVSAAKQRGIRVIITDHHLPGASLPDADAIVNPNLTGDAFPSKALAGVGVMFYVLLGVRRTLRDQGWYKKNNLMEPDLSSLLDLVALGTVADLVPLDFNNRILVSAGLRRIRQGKMCAGIRALIAVSGRDVAQMTTADLGFAIAPRINAAGRLEDMRIGIQCLIIDDLTQATQWAELLQQINAERRELQGVMVQEAENLVLRDYDQDKLSAGVCLFEAEWHTGVIGLVASRIKEQLHRPVIAFACAPEETGVLRGSARSVTGLHLRDAIASVAAQYPETVLRFGGHAMAAGLSIRATHFEQFAQAFDHVVQRQLGHAVGQAELLTDGALAADEITLDNAEVLRDAAPWGQNFTEPVFDNIFTVVDYKVVGTQHVRLQLQLLGSTSCHTAMYFGGAAAGRPPDQIHVAYQMHVDTWRAQKRVTLFVQHWNTVCSSE